MFELVKPGELYRWACNLLGKATPNPARRQKMEAEIRRQRQRVRELESAAVSASGAPGAPEELAKAEDRLDKLVRVRDQPDFRRAMRITGLGLKVEQVVRFSAVGALASLVVTLCVAIPFMSWMGLDSLTIAAGCAGIAIAAPLAVFMWLVGYPERLAKAVEAEAFGSAPEVVNYIVMSMELSPSLDKALAFAAENAEGPMAQELKGLLWKVRVREHATVEEALMAYASGLEGVNEELRSALYNVLSASKESDREKMRSSLRRASDGVLAGTRQRVEGFAASLATPATVLFSLGILLPMIIGSMLPMMSMGGLDIAAVDSAPAEDWTRVFAVSVLAMDLLFPFIAFAYASSILAKRPGLHSVALRESKPLADILLAGMVFTSFAVAAYAFGSSVDMWGLGWSLSALVLLTGAGLSLWLVLRSHVRVSELRSLEALEDQMPDMLFQLGSRLGEGRSLESALEDVSRTMRDTEMGVFLSDVLARTRRSGAGLHETLFAGRNGMLVRHPSAKLRATMRLVTEAAAKDQETVSGMLMTMSNHMRDLSASDKDMRLKLRSTIDSMRNTALLFAPVIMGVTVGLYGLLSGTFSEMNGSEAMPTPHFIAVIGVYLLATVATMTYFCSGIEKGKGRWRRDTAAALPVAAMIFCVTSVSALLAFG
jgi:Flp pilus assembly protein TadB